MRVHRPLSRAEVIAADGHATSILGLSTLCLMENAGRGLADVTCSILRLYGIESVTIVAGRGQNGGDGLVCARHLLLRGIPVRILLAAPAGDYPLSGAPGMHLATARALGIPVQEVADSPSLASAASREPAAWGLLVDAVLGTGLKGPVRGPTADVLSWMGGTGAIVVAADLPSGLDADTGEAMGPVPTCAATATFLAPKTGLSRGRGPELAGRVVVCDIGVPVEALVPRGGSPPASPPSSR